MVHCFPRLGGMHWDKFYTAAPRRRSQSVEQYKIVKRAWELSKRYGINQMTVASRLPEIEGDKPVRKTFRSYPIGYFHIDIAEVQTTEGKLRLFVAIDRISKFAYAELHREAGKMVAAQFLRNLIAAVPYTIHTVLTDNGIQFTNHARHKYVFHHIFDRICDENGIEQKAHQN